MSSLYIVFRSLRCVHKEILEVGPRSRYVVGSKWREHERNQPFRVKANWTEWCACWRVHVQTKWRVRLAHPQI